MIAYNKNDSPGGTVFEAVDEIICSYAVSNPDEFVVIHGGMRLTRAALERRAELFAADLAREGILPGETVAICLPRSIDQIIASLGIMKAGAACLALSPVAPSELLRFRLADCGVGCIVVGDLNDPVPGLAGVRLITLARPRDVLKTSEPTWPKQHNISNVACVVPVEGPGGPTCGAEITHANLFFVADWLRSDFRINAGDRVCHMAQPGTSTAMLELWPALACGATIVIMDDVVATDAASTCAWLKRERISVILAAENAVEALMLPCWGEDDALRLVMAESDSAAAISGRHGFQVVATYGHDECALITTARQIPPNDRLGGPNLGRPINGASVHILDEAGEPVVPGDEGNVWIGGLGVGRGYRNRPDLTADRFVPDPFGHNPSGMIFSTGRRARSLVGGGIARCGPASPSAR